MSAEVLAGRLAVQVAAPGEALPLAVVRTLAYADVFDYPLTLNEIQRYLIGMAAAVGEVSRVITGELLPAGWVERHDGYYTLPGRGGLAAVRQMRRQQAQHLWPRARRYAGWLRALPYVRMVAVTGALAMDNEPGRDLDFLVVTEPGRLWLCRGLAMLLVRLARRLGDELCPNYFITTRALRFPSEDLYTAHELAQMIPLYGMPVYSQIRSLNAWTEGFLPNAGGALQAAAEARVNLLRGAAEAVLWSPPGGWLERWEMQRKVRKLSVQSGPANEASFGPEANEVSFGRDWCKGHFGGYGHKTLAAYHQRLEALGLVAAERLIV